MITFKSHSGIHTLKAEQILPISLEEAWTFFSSPLNLPTITPSEMSFKITSEVDKPAYQGQIISYKVGLFPGLKVNWVTEITAVEKLSHFIDEQRFGPYTMWHHEHFFEAMPDGKTLATDKVSYKIPLGPLGNLLNTLFIKNKLKHIFSFRATKLNELFPND
ncbi:SRPBCC family protein [Arcticibacterium luteifluviistationis]|uniref:Cell division inhibitor n=1 Tax=Arcticibacterium luteifluviistationis TaxID=1784714 RepID=A0A2Z4GCK1_9BACT|nr:SRPBCC family protein [Arcticibacterium luteifluviistationis]AWV99019.1 hypothetical protein DJ013_12930 [Arcticibacterium luteifluviistationis]